ncbi:MAG: hypothetical protein QM619_06055 [Micropruina sp.]
MTLYPLPSAAASVNANTPATTRLLTDSICSSFVEFWHRQRNGEPEEE